MVNWKFPNVEPGQEIEIDTEKDEYFFACCDCHLVHRLRFRVKGKKIYMSGWRDNRKTSALPCNRDIQTKRKKKDPNCIQRLEGGGGGGGGGGGAGGGGIERPRGCAWSHQRDSGWVVLGVVCGAGAVGVEVDVRVSGSGGAWTKQARRSGVGLSGGYPSVANGDLSEGSVLAPKQVRRRHRGRHDRAVTAHSKVVEHGCGGVVVRGGAGVFEQRDWEGVRGWRMDHRSWRMENG